jgi:hypothetical protein
MDQVLICTIDQIIEIFLFFSKKIWSLFENYLVTIWKLFWLL